MEKSQSNAPVNNRINAIRAKLRAIPAPPVDEAIPEEQPESSEAEFDFINPDYTPIYARRSQMILNMREEPEILPQLKEYYKTHPADFIHDWGMTTDPRNAELGLPTTLPFLLFPRQREYIDWLYERWLGRGNGLVEKSRDMGVSWLCVGFAVWMWTFYPGSVIGFGSRKQDYVDKSGDPKCLFWKVRKFIEYLPAEFQPKGYNENKHGLFLRIINPENEAAIVGESGDEVGRGNRTSIYFVDEAAFCEHQDVIDAALSQTSNCKIDVSTPNGNGNAFYRKRHNGKTPVFTFHWMQDPRKDKAWYDKQVSTLDAVIVAQEINIDYNASVADSFIDGNHISAAQRTPVIDIDILGPWMIGVDAAHYGDDKSVIHSRRGRFNAEQKEFAKLDGPQLAGAVTDHCNTLEEAGGEIGAIVIELDGPGVSAYDHLKLGKYKNVLRGVHTGARVSDNKNWNIRARMWRALRDYLGSPPVHMHDEPEVKSEMAAMRYSYKDGLLLMQSKKEYKSLYGKSPDHADAMALTFAVTPKLEAVSLSDMNKKIQAAKKGLKRNNSWLNK